MNVGEICVRNVVTVRESDELSKAAISEELLGVAGSVREELTMEKALRP